MIQIGKKKIELRDLAHKINFLQADALKLPFANDSFDVTGIAFGIRNIPDRIQALKEMLRVTVPGGQVMVLEMTFVQSRVFKLFYYAYLNYLLPLLAKIFSSHTEAYYYLADSIMNFPDPAALTRLMENAGLTDVQKYPLTFGITYLHIGSKPQIGSDAISYKTKA